MDVKMSATEKEQLVDVDLEEQQQRDDTKSVTTVVDLDDSIDESVEIFHVDGLPRQDSDDQEDGEDNFDNERIQPTSCHTTETERHNKSFLSALVPALDTRPCQIVLVLLLCAILATMVVAALFVFPSSNNSSDKVVRGGIRGSGNPQDNAHDTAGAGNDDQHPTTSTTYDEEPTPTPTSAFLQVLMAETLQEMIHSLPEQQQQQQDTAVVATSTSSPTPETAIFTLYTNNGNVIDLKDEQPIEQPSSPSLPPVPATFRPASCQSNVATANAEYTFCIYPFPFATLSFREDAAHTSDGHSVVDATISTLCPTDHNKDDDDDERCTCMVAVQTMSNSVVTCQSCQLAPASSSSSSPNDDNNNPYEQVFHSRFDCSNVVVGDCVGRDASGNCIAN